MSESPLTETDRTYRVYTWPSGNTQFSATDDESALAYVARNWPFLGQRALSLVEVLPHGKQRDIPLPRS